MKITPEEMSGLAKRALENDQKALAGILYAVAAVLNVGSERAMLDHLDPFTRNQLELMKQEHERLIQSN